MRVMTEESFGPVLTVERFTDEDDAVRIANDTHYGLAGAVFTSDVSKAQRVVEGGAPIAWPSSVECHERTARDFGNTFHSPVRVSEQAE